MRGTKKVTIYMFVCLVNIFDVFLTKVCQSCQMIIRMVSYGMTIIQDHLEYIRMFFYIFAHTEEGCFYVVLTKQF